MTDHDRYIEAARAKYMGDSDIEVLDIDDVDVIDGAWISARIFVRDDELEPIPGPKPEDPPPWPVGTVVRDTKTGYRIVLTHPLLRSDAYEFVCEKAHGEKPHPDYSYICNKRWCRCRS